MKTCPLIHLLSLAVGGFFLWAAGPKLTDPAAFYASILNYRLVGADAAWALALWLPWLEALAGLALIAPPTRRAGGLIIGVLLAVFIVALGSALARGLGIDCGCTGGEGTPATVALLRNTILLVALGIVLWSGRKSCELS